MLIMINKISWEIIISNAFPSKLEKFPQDFFLKISVYWAFCILIIFIVYYIPHKLSITKLLLEKNIFFSTYYKLSKIETALADTRVPIVIYLY